MGGSNVSELTDAEARVCRLVATESFKSPRAALASITATGLTVEDFTEYAWAWEAICRLVTAGNPATLTALGNTDAAKRLLVGRETEAYAAELPRLAAVVADAGMERRALVALENARDALLEGPGGALERINEASRALSRIVRLGPVVPARHHVEAGAHLASARAMDGEGVVPTGFLALDAVVGGWQPTLNVIAAMTSVGKSAFLAGTVREIAKAGHTVGVFSLEDSAMWLGWRFLARESGIPQWVLRHRVLNGEQQDALAAAMAPEVVGWTDRVLVDDEKRKRPGDLVLKARALVLQRGCKIIFVDHLGELNFAGGERGYSLADAIDNALIQLRAVADELQVPVVVVSHVNRGVTDQNKKPTLTDMKGSSGIENKARLLLALSRDPLDAEISVSVLKNTNGPSGMDVSLAWDKLSATVGQARAATGVPHADG